MRMSSRSLRTTLLLKALKPLSPFCAANTPLTSSLSTVSSNFPQLSDSPPSLLSKLIFSRRLSSLGEETHAPAAIDHHLVLQEDEYQRLANSTIHHLLEKLEEYGDSVEIEGYDVDYGNEVLTLKLGNSGTYVINKQTPNRQIWMSSPVSGPSRFDWDQNAQAWIYRRTKEQMVKVLETELEQLCGEPVNLS